MNLKPLSAIVGEQHVLTGEAARASEVDWRERYEGRALAVVRPASTQEVAQVVRWCAEHQVGIVPQGGNTGLCGGATPDATGTQLVLSLSRLDRIRAIDTDNDTLVAEAGCVLQTVQEAARQADRLFPLSLAAEGSCTIGGNLATNAGGTQVLRYGNTRDLVLGIEAVTPSGDILRSLTGLRKDNTGYDLRHLFIGSEGTLGIITAATLKLFPLPVAQRTALLALRSIDDALTVLRAARKGFGPALTGFELIAANCLQGVVRCFPQQRIPFEGASAQAPWFALLELSDSESAEHAQAQFEKVLGALLESDVIVDAVIAETVAQSHALWHLRESIPLAEKVFGKSVKHDISLPVSAIPGFVTETNALLQQAFPGVEHVVFGHLGDGNLHYNVAAGEGRTQAQLLEQQDRIFEIVFDSVARFHGSISAEHGIGQLKRDLLPRYKDPVALALMRDIKRVLDPSGIMNPGKML